MIYLNRAHLETLGWHWHELLDVVRSSVSIIQHNDYAQPLKPYLRYGDLKNRIIAMPAYVGGDVEVAGIKWIASFPENIKRGIPRAHSTTILNDSESGKPTCAINTSLVSVVRTAAVSGVVVDKYLRRCPGSKKLNVGIVGFGPIGRMHLEMIGAILGDRIAQVNIYDLNPISQDDVPISLRSKVQICDAWQAAYTNADIFITATVAKDRYINLAPKPGSLQLNVSLRDYMPMLRRFMDVIIVDSWTEVCRENTDIEQMHLSMHLKKEDTCSIAEFLQHDEVSNGQQVYMFNPMGMAVFDIAVASYYHRKAMANNVGVVLED